MTALRLPQPRERYQPSPCHDAGLRLGDLFQPGDLGAATLSPESAAGWRVLGKSRRHCLFKAITTTVREQHPRLSLLDRNSLAAHWPATKYLLFYEHPHNLRCGNLYSLRGLSYRGIGIGEKSHKPFMHFPSSQDRADKSFRHWSQGFEAFAAASDPVFCGIDHVHFSFTRNAV